MQATSTNLEDIRKTTGRFTWGTIMAFHDVGPYTIVEFISYDSSNQTAFHVYVDGKDTANSTSSLDSALVLAMAFKNVESKNEARFMAMGACKLLGVKNP